MAISYWELLVHCDHSKKAHLYWKMVFKMLIIGANSMKEDDIDNLVSLKTVRGQSCVLLLVKGTFFFFCLLRFIGFC